jgi:hypothetical protein
VVLTVDDKLDNELLMLGAVVAALIGGPVTAAVPDAADPRSAYLWVRTDFLKSRYRLTITLDPENADADEAAISK